MNKAKRKGGFLIIAIILAVLAIPFGILLYSSYFAWDSQFEGNNYKVAFEKDSKLYELGISGNSFAFALFIPNLGTNYSSFTSRFSILYFKPQLQPISCLIKLSSNL